MEEPVGQLLEVFGYGVELLILSGFLAANLRTMNKTIIFPNYYVYLTMTIIFLLFGIFSLIFNSVWQDCPVNENIRFLYLPAFIVLVFVHEFLHAVVAYYFTKVKESTKIKIGVNLKRMIAFCSCEETFNVRQTCIITLAPLLLLGLFPLLISVVEGSQIVYKISLVMISVSAGDILVFCHLCTKQRNLPVNVRILHKHIVIELGT